MKSWVIDTNVVVSGLLTPGGNPARVLNAVIEGRVKLVYDARILAEYRDVLRRPKLRVHPLQIETFLDSLRGQMLVSPKCIEVEGPDADDIIFLEAALVTEARTIVTGNLADYPARILNGVRVITPVEAVKELSRSP